MTQTVIRTAFPPGFFDRYIKGPCNNALCSHPNCPEMRAELRAFAMESYRRELRRLERKRKVRR